jgi:cell fate regulator YaaT (PSP1 superfamily)
MQNVVGVRFKRGGKVYWFDPGQFVTTVNSYVIVETIRGIEMGEIVIPLREISDESIVVPLKKVIRLASDTDIKHNQENKAKSLEVLEVCNEKILEHNLDMKLIDVEYTFDNNKILFYFTADGRIDFRELVKDLAAIFKTRIELRQIGVRDETKMTGGIGTCGRVLCCKSFLGDFHPVSIKMAKEQGMPLNPTKISGICGRLMCCLNYEQKAYEDILRRSPRQGAVVETVDGSGVVVSVNLLKEKLKVRLSHGTETEMKEYKLEDIKIIKNVSLEDEHGAAIIQELKELED